MLDDQMIDAFLADLLRGESAKWPTAWRDPQVAEAVSRRAIYHGIAGYFIQRFADLSSWPESVSKALRQEAIGQVMWELRHRNVLAMLIEQLAEAGVTTVVMKGTALAYALYSDPALRRRGDTDLLVQRRDLRKARSILQARGFMRPGHGHGLFGEIHFQEVWQYNPGDGSRHDIDLHWEVTNSRALGTVLNAEDCLARAVPLPRLSPSARATDPVTRLLHGCVNRAVHRTSGYRSIDRNFYDGNRLAWAVDFDLQASAFSGDDWQRFTNLACKRGVAALCLDALQLANMRLGTSIPTEVEAALKSAPQDTNASRYIQSPGGIATALADLRATPGVKDKMTFVLARAFPSAAFLREKYPGLPRWPVWALHLLRLTQALRRASIAETRRWT